MKDNNGCTPEVGDFVAFNWSGDIAAGYITRIGSSGGYRGVRPIYHIERVIPEPGADENKKSIVRGGARCVLVLTSKDGKVQL